MTPDCCSRSFLGRIALKLPHNFRTDTRKQPVLAGQSRTTTKGLRPANVLARGPFHLVAGAGFEPGRHTPTDLQNDNAPRRDLRVHRSPNLGTNSSTHQGIARSELYDWWQIAVRTVTSGWRRRPTSRRAEEASPRRNRTRRPRPCRTSRR